MLSLSLSSSSVDVRPFGYLGLYRPTDLSSRCLILVQDIIDPLPFLLCSICVEFDEWVLPSAI